MNKLLTFGTPDPDDPESWPNYIEAVELGPEHILDLIRMAEDRELRDIEGGDEEEDKDDISYTAPIHALRALRQLKAQGAIQPVADLLPRMDDDEWMLEDMAHIFGMIGPAAIPTLATYVAASSRETYSRAYAANSLTEIARKFPEHHAECIAAICKPLEVVAEADEELNGLLISNLIDPKALEAVSIIELAFAEDRVNRSITGDWDEVQVELGLKERSEVPTRRMNMLGSFLEPNPALSSYGNRDTRSADWKPQPTRHRASKKARAKIVKQSRKKNRRKDS